MAQYINKDALAAWIKEKKIPFKKDIDDGVYPTYLCALMDFEDFIDTLEVKDVDLEKEIENELKRTWYGEYLDTDKFKESAVYFYELGLKA